MVILQKIKNRINRNSYYLNFRDSLRKIYYRSAFKDIRTVVLTIGFSRTGSSLLGFLLTAHPNMVVVQEPSLKEATGSRVYRGNAALACISRMYNGALNGFFYTILDQDRLRYQNGISPSTQIKQQKSLRSPEQKVYYILVPNQHQGRFKRLKVIGVKSSYYNNVVLSRNNTLANLRSRLKERDIKLKFLFTVRNPYDRIAAISKRQNHSLEETVRIFEDSCKKQEELLKKIDRQDVFVNRHEDMCKDPRRQLARLCDFLQVPIPAGYIEDCASAVVRKPYKGRLDVNWSPELEQTVALMIEKYDFFSGYDWET